MEVEATRLALLRDGTTAGHFTLRRHETHVVVVEPNGHAFSHVDPRGRVTRHLTPTLLSAQRTLLRVTMEFRNRFALCAAVTPYVHPALWDPRDQTTRPDMVRRRRRTRRQADQDASDPDAVTVGWPRAPSYTTRALWNDAAQRFEVESLDGAAQLQLHASGKMAHARFLLPVPRDATGGGDDDCVWVEQTFPPSAAPPCFAFAVRLLQRARLARGSGADAFSVDDDLDSEPTVYDLPRNGALDARPTFRPLSSPTTRTSVGGIPTDNSVESVTRWIKGLSRSLDRLIVAERASGIDWIVDTSEATRPTVLVMASSDAVGGFDGPLVECDRRFFRAFDPHGDVTQQFTVETLPLELRAFNSDFQWTTVILRHAAELFDATCRILPSESSDPNPNGMELKTATTLLEDVSNDVGRFRAFSDGRVRVVFADRTILQVAPSDFGDQCSFTFRDGSTGTCTSDSASPEHQSYVRVAMDFAQWAFATPEKRFRRHQLQLEQQALVARELHKITIRQELNGVASREPTGAHDAPWQPQAASLSQDAVAELLRETQLHMTHVRTLLEDTHRD